MKFKLNQHVTLKSNGSKCLVWSINKEGDELVLFLLGSRQYLTVKFDEVEA